LAGRSLRTGAAALALACALAGPAAAQSDVSAFLTRMTELESELRRLTARVEELERRLREHEADAEARFEDLDYRVIELEGGDPAAAFRSGAAEGAPVEEAEPETRGGAAAEAAGLGAPPSDLGALSFEGPPPSPAFDAAMRDLGALGPDAGAESVARFVAEAPDDPRAGEAYHRLGRAYLAGERPEAAARAFLTGVRSYGERAYGAENLLGLGQALAALGRTEDACGAFLEVPVRYPGAEAATRRAAANAAAEAGCP
jgi:TolA-binding protein